MTDFQNIQNPLLLSWKVHGRFMDPKRWFMEDSWVIHGRFMDASWVNSEKFMAKIRQ